MAEFQPLRWLCAAILIKTTSTVQSSLKTSSGSALVRAKSPDGGVPAGENYDDAEAPLMAPKQFMIMSAPTEKKVVWTTLHNMESKEGRAFSLIDSGLVQPMGIAFDRKNGLLYVADVGAKKILSYKIRVDTAGTGGPELVVSGLGYVVCQGHAVEWLTVDKFGNLFYTAPDTNNINKISTNVLGQLALGTIRPTALQVISQKSLEIEQTVEKRFNKSSKKEGQEEDKKVVQPHILSIYEAKLNPHVSEPASIWADGDDLYWTNMKDGKKAGTVVRGEVDPHLSKNESAFPADALSTVSSHAYGLGKAHGMMFFTRNGSIPGTGLVSGFYESTPENVLDFETTIAKPRGLAFDGDATMYVADEAMGQVWSFPVGRFMAEAPLSLVVKMKGCYDITIMSTADPCYRKVQVDSGRENGQANSAGAKTSVAREDGVKLSLISSDDAGEAYDTIKGHAFRSEQGYTFVLLTLAVALGQTFLSS